MPPYDRLGSFSSFDRLFQICGAETANVMSSKGVRVLLMSDKVFCC